jgi:peptidoglycan/xylan/chitin deacetylase (PgdA/CDA1 family)
MTGRKPLSSVTGLSAALVLVLLGAVLLAACAAPRTRTTTRTFSRKSKSYAVVQTREGDTMAVLAKRYLGDPGHAWAIAELNHVAEVEPGQFVVVPLAPLHKGGITEEGHQLVPVLQYSALAAEPGDPSVVSAAAFREQMTLLRDRGCTPIGVDAFYDFLEFRNDLPSKAVLITIDDHGQGTYDVALPILREFGWPAVVFVCTDLVTGKGGALSWDQVREMEAAGISVQHRTKSLRNLARRKDDETFEDFVVAVDRELTVASRVLFQETGKEPRYHAYPYGSVNEMVIALLEKNGFRGAMTLTPGANPFFTDNYLVRRNPLNGQTTTADLEKMLVFFQEVSRTDRGDEAAKEAAP